jgi:hypothetical protein
MGILNRKRVSNHKVADAPIQAEPVERTILRDISAKLAQARDDLAAAEQYRQA